MIVATADTLRQAWAEFAWEVGHQEELIIAGVQRIHRGVVWQVPAKVFLDNSLPLAATGYTVNKLKQLQRNYYNPLSVERAKKDVRWRIENKKYGSGVFDFRGTEKKGTKQDYCIASAVVGYYPQKKCTTVDVFYRTAELIKRFRGDLVFFREFILSHFSDSFQHAPPSDVTMHFANCTFHPMFVVLLIGQTPDEWEDHLERIRKDNRKLYLNILYWTFRYLMGPARWVENYSSAHQVQKIAFASMSVDLLYDVRRYVRRALIKNLPDLPKSVTECRDFWDKPVEKSDAHLQHVPRRNRRNASRPQRDGD